MDAGEVGRVEAELLRGDIAVVREKLLFPWEGEFGVFLTLRPWHIACVLAGAPFFSTVGTEPEMGDAQEHFAALGVRTVRFLHKFDRRRETSARGKKRYIPDKRQLRRHFGEDWRLVLEAWPAVRFVAPVARLVGDHGNDLGLIEAITPWKQEAAVILEASNPHELVKGAVRQRLTTVAAQLRRLKPDPRRGRERRLTVQEVVEQALHPDRATLRALTYEPTGEPLRAYIHWLTATRNRVRDLANEPIVLGALDGTEVTRSPGGLRRWKSEGRDKDQAGNPRNPVDVALEADALRQHRDHQGGTRTAAEAALLLGCPSRSVLPAIRRAVLAGDLAEPKRLREGHSYALTGDDIEIIRKHVGVRRGARGVFTVRKLARVLGVPAETVVKAIREHLVELRERGSSSRLSRYAGAIGTAMESEDPELWPVSDELSRVLTRKLRK